MSNLIKNVAPAIPPKGYENCTCIRVDMHKSFATREQYYLIMRSKKSVVNCVWFNYYVDGKLYSQDIVEGEIFNEAVKAVNKGEL